MAITLVSEDVAQVGYEFIFHGAAPECSQCKLRQVCVGNLNQGSQYRIRSLRPKRHSCLLLPSDEKAVVVEVEEVPRSFTVEPQVAMPGILISHHSDFCPEVGCPYWDACVPSALSLPYKIQITSLVKKSISCFLDRSLVLIKGLPKPSK